jgi:hypothetical protein
MFRDNDRELQGVGSKGWLPGERASAHSWRFQTLQQQRQQDIDPRRQRRIAPFLGRYAPPAMSSRAMDESPALRWNLGFLHRFPSLVARLLQRETRRLATFTWLICGGE